MVAMAEPVLWVPAAASRSQCLSVAADIFVVFQVLTMAYFTYAHVHESKCKCGVLFAGRGLHHEFGSGGSVEC